MNSIAFRLITNGNHGLVTFNTPGAPGGSGTNPFTVDTTGKTDSQLHREICDKYAAIGIPTILHTPPDKGGFIDTTSVTGHSIESFNPPSVTQFDVTPVAGQTVVSQVSGTNTVSISAVPALSEWGMIILIAVLVLSGMWLIRRRQKLQSV